jgi:hypothetical protein
MQKATASAGGAEVSRRELVTVTGLLGATALLAACTTGTTTALSSSQTPAVATVAGTSAPGVGRSASVVGSASSAASPVVPTTSVR